MVPTLGLESEPGTGAPLRQEPELNPLSLQKSELRGNSRHYALKPEELNALERAAETARERAYVRLMARWGLRAAETAHFCFDWFSGQRGVLTIPRMCRCPSCLTAGKPFRSKTEAG